MQRGFDSGPAKPVDLAISEPPIAPVALSFDSSPQTVPSPPGRHSRVPAAGRRLGAWAIDLALLGGVCAAHAQAASRLTGRDLASVLTSAPTLWLGLAATLAFAWSFLFVALCGRTPGMALTGQRLEAPGGAPPKPLRAFLRALLAVGFAAPGLLGFVLALFDPRGQTLHDRICRCTTVVD